VAAPPLPPQWPARAKRRHGSSSRSGSQACERNAASLADATIPPPNDFFFCSRIGGLRRPSLAPTKRLY
jgi:hypothetical protein